MAELKTKPSRASVEAFLGGIADEARRKDCLALATMMKQATKAEPTMWGPSIVGFGSYHYKYESGREGDWFLTGFSPRKDSLTVYVGGALQSDAVLLRKLGKHKAGKGCLYIKKLSDVDTKVLQEIVRKSVARMK